MTKQLAQAKENLKAIKILVQAQGTSPQPDLLKLLTTIEKEIKHLQFKREGINFRW